MLAPPQNVKAILSISSLLTLGEAFFVIPPSWNLHIIMFLFVSHFLKNENERMRMKNIIVTSSTQEIKIQM